MAKIPLRAYTKEIDGLIDRGQYEQALAHCRHILKYIPKHIDTYRLMAKAYLESQRYGDASDVFQRVLSSIPDDFVSQLGMSIIREDEGNLDAAIWHMERAFEIQPSNGAIQSELRRLYGRRDGIEPPKIRLTRGALARMYFKGELYPQAINELRAALAADPQRPDLQLLLAKAYAKAGQKVEAVTTCNSVLKKLPYCIEANRIQAEILENTDRAEDALAFRQRAIAMNPYLGQVNPKAPNPEQVPDEAVVLERLDWMPDKSISSQPRWAASLGVNLVSQKTSREEVPDWLQELDSKSAETQADGSEDMVKVSPFVTESDESKSDEEVIPDWMKEAGWEPSSGDTTRVEMGYSFEEELEEAEDDGLAPAEIPSWLRGLAPEDALSTDQPSRFGTEEIDQKLIEALDSAALPWLEESPPGTGDAIPDWLGDTEASQDKAIDEAPAAGLPDWMVGATAAGLGAAIGAAAGRGQGQDEEQDFPSAEEPVGAEFSEEFSTEIQADSASDTPDWLSEMEAAGEAQPEESISSPAEEAGLPEWLVGATAISAISHLEGGGDELEGERPEIQEEDTLAEQAPTDLPDWLVASPEDEESSELLPEELPDWLSGMDAQDAPPEKDEEPEWMTEAPASEIDSDRETVKSEDADMPEWLGAAAGAALGAAALASSGDDETQDAEPTLEEEAELLDFSEQMPQKSSPFDELPEEMLAEIQEEVTPEDEEAAFAWLEGLAAKQGISEALLLNPDERLDEPPEWVQQEASLAESALILGEEEELLEMADGEQGLDELLPPEYSDQEIALVEPGELVDISPLEDVPTDTSPEEFLPDWLRAAGPESEVAQAEAALEDEGEIPAWLSQMDSPIEESPEFSFFASEGELSEEEMLDWLPELSEVADLESTLTKGEEATDLSDWLSQMPAIGEEPGQAEPVQDDTRLTKDEKPELQAAIQDTQPTDSEAPQEPVPPQPEQDEIPTWAIGAAAAVFAVDRGSAADEDSSQVEEPEMASGIPEWLDEPEPGPESTPVGLSADRLEIEEPAIVREDTQPSSTTFETDSEEAESSTEGEGEGSAISVEETSASPAVSESEKMISDEDAAFAWLESLAVKQGATEALLLNPEERLDEPPEWVLEESLTPEDEPPDAAVVTEAHLDAESMPEQAADLHDEVIEPTDKTESEEEELPEWLIGAGVTASAAAAAMLAEQDQKPDADTISESELETPAMELQELEAGVDELLPDEELPELPEWLADFEPEPAESGEEYDLVAEETWKPEMADVESISEAVAQEKEISPLDLNRASLIEIERLPGVGFRRAQALVEYRQQHGPFENLDQVAPVEGFDQELLTEIAQYVRVVSATPAGEGRDDQVEVDLLIQARAAIYQADMDTALQNYQSLIEQKQNLPEVVKDLQEALYNNPANGSLWMTLGDAQMRAGQLHKAFESYNKAEELLV